MSSKGYAAARPRAAPRGPAFGALGYKRALEVLPYGIGYGETTPGVLGGKKVKPRRRK